MSGYPEGLILDEVQRVPSLFSYIQAIVDEVGREDMFVLTGSFHFSLMEGISQSLAGRVAMLNLLPFSYSELLEGGVGPDSIEGILYTGGYPRIHDKRLAPTEWYANYVMTYLERDVRTLKNISDIAVFQQFLKMCAARAGQIINLSSLGDDCGITHNTAKSWLSLLQASFIVFLLRPHYRNFNKRMIKSPKMYFFDSGLLCYLLGITSPDVLSTHANRGQVFESWVISELLKGRFNRGLRENLYFWRDNSGHEIDCIAEQDGSLIPIEIKAGKTVSRDFFKGLTYWSKLAGVPAEKACLVYAGEIPQARKEGRVLDWRSFAKMLPFEI